MALGIISMDNTHAIGSIGKPTSQPKKAERAENEGILNKFPPPRKTADTPKRSSRRCFRLCSVASYDASRTSDSTYTLVPA